MKTKGHIILLVLAIVTLFALNLVIGSVKIPVSDVVSILLGDDGAKPSWRFIILEWRSTCRQRTDAADSFPQPFGWSKHFWYQ